MKKMKNESRLGRVLEVEINTSISLPINAYFSKKTSRFRFRKKSPSNLK